MYDNKVVQRRRNCFLINRIRIHSYMIFVLNEARFTGKRAEETHKHVSEIIPILKDVRPNYLTLAQKKELSIVPMTFNQNFFHCSQHLYHNEKKNHNCIPPNPPTILYTVQERNE